MNFIITLLLITALAPLGANADVCSFLNSGAEPCRSNSASSQLQQLAQILSSSGDGNHDGRVPDREQAARYCLRKPINQDSETLCSNPWKSVCEPVMKNLSRGSTPGVFGYGESVSALQDQVASKVGSSRTGSNRSAIFNNLLNSDGGPGAFQALGKKYPSIFSQSSSLTSLRNDYLDYLDPRRHKKVRTWNDYVSSTEREASLMKMQDHEILRVTNEWRKKEKEIDSKFNVGSSAHVSKPGTPHWQAHQDSNAWLNAQTSRIRAEYQKKIEQDTSGQEKHFLNSLRAFSSDRDAGNGLLVIASKLESVASPQSEPGDTYPSGDQAVRRESLNQIEAMLKSDLNLIASNHPDHTSAIQSRALHLQATTASSYLASLFQNQKQEGGKLTASLNYLSHCGSNGMEKRAFYARYKDASGAHRESIVLCPGLELAYEFEGPEAVYGALAEASADYLTGSCHGDCEPIQGLSAEEQKFMTEFQLSKFKGCDGIHSVEETLIVDRGIVGKKERGETLLRKRSDFFAGELIGARLKSTYANSVAQGRALVKSAILLQCTKNPDVINTIDNGDIREFLGCAGSCGENLTCSGMGQPKVNDNKACRLTCQEGCNLSIGNSQETVSIFNPEKGVAQHCTCTNGQKAAPMPEGFRCPTGTQPRACDFAGGHGENSWCMTMSRGGSQAKGLTCSSDPNLPCQQAVRAGARGVTCRHPEFVDIEDLLDRYEASLNSCQSQSNAPVKNLKPVPVSGPKDRPEGRGTGTRAN